MQITHFWPNQGCTARHACDPLGHVLRESWVLSLVESCRPVSAQSSLLFFGSCRFFFLPLFSFLLSFFSCRPVRSRRRWQTSIVLAVVLYSTSYVSILCIVVICTEYAWSSDHADECEIRRIRYSTSLFSGILFLPAYERPLPRFNRNYSHSDKGTLYFVS